MGVVVGDDEVAQIIGRLRAYRRVAVPALRHPVVRLKEADQVGIAPVPPQGVERSFIVTAHAPIKHLDPYGPIGIPRINAVTCEFLTMPG